MNILVINSGSSSIKYKLFDMTNGQVLIKGQLERIGGDAKLRHARYTEQKVFEETISERKIIDHYVAFQLIRQIFDDEIQEFGSMAILGIGHRVVHGGARFSQPTLIDDHVLHAIDEVSDLAPLHNPANVTGIKICRSMFSDVEQVAVFDTAFHQSMPEVAYRYAVPEAWYSQYQVRRYGFHGTSHANIAQQTADYLQQPIDKLNLITLHLGNGASMAAIRSGVCVDTTMGLTPLEGLMMGSRCGDIDASIPFYIHSRTQARFDDIESDLNRNSGFNGVCGKNDLREIIRIAQVGDEHAQLAIDMYCYRIRKYIGAYMAVLNKIDALVFTAGVGENSALIRAQICCNLDGMGIGIDEEQNHKPLETVLEIQAQHSKIKVIVVRTREEWEIARQTLACIKHKHTGKT